MVLLRLGQLRVDRQRDDPLRLRLGDREGALGEVEVRVGRLEMERDRVVDAGVDAVPVEPGAQRIAVLRLDLDHVQVVHGPHVRARSAPGHAGHLGQERVVAGGDPAAAAGPRRPGGAA